MPGSGGGKNLLRVRGQLDDQISGKLAKIRDNFDRLGASKGATTLLQGVGMGAGIAAWGALSSAIQQVPAALMDMARAAAADETSQNRLYTAVAANTKGWDGNREAIEAVIAKRMELAFSDEEQRDSLALLVARTGDVTEALSIQRTAMDLARLKGISLGEASKALAMALSGQGRALKELGINVGEMTDKHEALTAVQAKAAGQASAYAESSAGSFESLQIAVDELGEAVGYHLLPYLKDLATVLREDVLTQADELADAFGFVGDGITVLTTPFRVVIEAADRTSAAFGALSGDTEDLTNMMMKVPGVAEDVAAAQANAERSSGAWTERLTGLASSLAGSSSALDEFGGSVDGATSEVGDAIETLRGMPRVIGRGTTEIDKMRSAWGLLDDELERQRAVQDLPDEITVAVGAAKAAHRELRQALKSGDAVSIAAARLKYREARRNLADLRAEYDRFRAEVSAPIYSGGLIVVKGKKPPKRGAAGGRAEEGEPFIVGEHGRELFVPEQGGRIVPNNELMRLGDRASAAVAPAPVNLVVYLDSEQIAARVERRQYFAAATAPVSVR